MARNKGLEIAKGKFVTFIDADDYWIDGYITSLVDFLDAHEECVAVSCICKNLALGKTASYNPLSTQDDSSVEDEKGKRVDEPFVLDDFYSYWARECHVGTCSTVIRTEIARRCGGMRTELRVSEDYEFWFTVASYGKWAIVPQVLYISDGDIVTSANGWLNKMKKRWDNAPSVKEWERRILSIDSSLCNHGGYRQAVGRVSRTLTYCQLLSGRREMARQEAMKYGDYFTKDAIGNLMVVCRHNALLWWVLCKLLCYREYHR